MKKHSLLFAPLLAICLQLPSMAAENGSPAPRMDGLIGSGQFQAAYDLGQDNLEEW